MFLNLQIVHVVNPKDCKNHKGKKLVEVKKLYNFRGL